MIVTDNPLSGEHLHQLLKRIAPDRPVQLAGSEREAHTLLENQEFDIIFATFDRGADQCTDFLNEVWNAHPRTVRFFLAEQVSGAHLVSSALGAHHLLPVPVTEQSLLGALRRGDAINRFLRDSDVQALVSRMRTLPSRPSLYTEVLRELKSPTASPQTVAELVSRDLAISTKLIQLVNSTFYAVQEPVTEPAAAVMLLGFETTASLVLSIEALARFDKVKPLYFSMDRIWKHSQSVAQSARSIAELAGASPEVVRDAWTAGLLHDIGKLALALNFEEQYNTAVQTARSQHLPLCEIEKKMFGATHADAGAYLLCLWGLPLPIVEAVAQHHRPAAELLPPFSAGTALHLAENLTAETGSPKAPRPNPDLNYPAELGLEVQMDAFQEIVGAAGYSPDEATRAADQAINASTRPLPADAAPAPLPEVRPASAKQRRIQYLAFVGFVFFAVSVLSFFWNNFGPVDNAQSVEVSPLPESVERVAQIEEPSAPPLPLPEPEVPSSVLTGPQPKVTLQGILYNGARSSLIINDKLFRVGDLVEGARIVSVDRQSVTLERAGEQYLLRLEAP